MSIWTAIEAEIAAAAKAAAHAIAAAAAYFKPVLIATAAEIGQVAVQAVLAEAPKVISGSEKLNAAASNIVTTLGTSGKSILMSDALAAAQTAYSKISEQVHAPAP